MVMEKLRICYKWLHKIWGWIFKWGKNGYGKEFNADTYDGALLFEGEFLNGERWNGNGVECYDNGGYFEGEYLNGKHWNGEGKEYNENGILIYFGKYLEGKKVDESLLC